MWGSEKKNLILLSALKLFAKQGYYNTKIADIAKYLDISVGSIYSYFPSKKSIAKAALKFVTHKIASILKEINQKDISQKEKIYLFVKEYFEMVDEFPDAIDYFFRVYLSNREIFCDEFDCGFALAKEFVDELRVLVNEGVEKREYKEHDFCVIFSTISGMLCAMTYLKGEKALQKEWEKYIEDVASAINRVLYC